MRRKIVIMKKFQEKLKGKKSEILGKSHHSVLSLSKMSYFKQKKLEEKLVKLEMKN